MTLEERMVDLLRKRVSRSRAAELLGVSRHSFALMVDSMGLDWPSGLRPGVTIDGITDTVAAHARRMGLPTATLAWRLKYNVDVTRRPTTRRISREEAQQFMDLRAAGLPPDEAAGRVGRSHANLHLVCKALFPDYLAVLAKLPRVRRDFRI